MFTPGDKLEYGHYTVLRELGSGGMGVVYHCRDEILQREIAIKMLLPELMADDDTVEVFRQEARLAAQLEHPNIVTIHNIGMENREGRLHHYIAMEYLPGGSLKQRINKESPEMEQCVEWMKQLTVGLNYAHKRGVVHQDIKPDNIFITHDGNLKIGDFGLALIATGVAVERAVQGKGTPAYMSPELCRGEPQDHRSDIYSLGAVFFELLTKERPYKASGMIEMAMKHATAPIPSARKVNETVPDILDKAIQKMMAKAADDRYQSLQEVLTILEKLLLEMQVARLGVGTGSLTAAPVETPPPPKKEPLPPPLPAASDYAEDFAKYVADNTSTKKKPEESPAAKKKQGKEEPAPAQAEKPPAKEPPRKPLFDDETTGDIEPDLQDSVRSQIAQQAKAKPNGSGGTTAPRGKSGGPALAEVRLELIWVFKTQGPIGWTSSPVLSRDRKTLYVGSSDGTLYALDSSFGTRKWKFASGGAILSSPVIIEDKVLIASASGSLFALNGSGNELWSYKGTSPLVATPIVHNDGIIVAAMDGTVKLLNVEDGNPKWTYRAEGPVVASPQVLENLIFFGSRDRMMQALSLDKGWRQWNFQTQGPIVSSPLVSSDSVYIGSVDGTMYALEAESGRTIWTYATDKPIVSRGTLEFTSLTVCNEDKWVHCIEKYKGNLIWKARVRERVLCNLVSAGGNLYAATRDGWLQCISLKTGDVQWQSNCERRLESSPLVTTKVIYVAAVNGDVIAYKPPQV